MTFEQKKDHIIRCVKLGMELYRAELVSECTLEEIELLDKDKDFLKRIDQQYAIEEYALLTKHNVALEIAKTRGNASPIQWKLGKLNPKRWDSKDKETILTVPESIKVNLVGKGIEND